MEFENDDNLAYLLRRADEAAGLSSRLTDVAARVRRRHARRRRMMRTGAASGAAAAVVVAALLGWHVLDRDHPPDQVVAANDPIPPVEAASIASLRAEAERLERECELREATVERILASRRRAAVPAVDPALDLAWQREQAALVLVHQGDRLARDFNLPQSAAVAYRQARDTFPGTRWAAIADTRLNESETVH